jgi:hypothetical protein
MAKLPNVSRKQLTFAQQFALDKLKSFVESEESFFRLDGYAGSGKSFLICHLMEWLARSEFAFVAAAPTNKAAKNLKLLAKATGIDIDVKTVAQLLGQQPEINEETGLEEFTSNNDAQFDDYDVIIIDEFSMISRSNFVSIVDAVAMTIDTKVIFVGDSAQLPPVKEDNPIVAVSEYIDSTVTLEEIVRYEGEIAVVAEKIRTEDKYQQIIYPFCCSKDGTIVCQPRKKWLETVIEHFSCDVTVHSPPKTNCRLSPNKFEPGKMLYAINYGSTK